MSFLMGTVAEEGAPKDLEEKNGVYAHMVKTADRKPELETCVKKGKGGSAMKRNQWKQENIRLGTHREDYGSWMSNSVFYIIGGIRFWPLCWLSLSFYVFHVAVLRCAVCRHHNPHLWFC